MHEIKNVSGIIPDTICISNNYSYLHMHMHEALVVKGLRLCTNMYSDMHDELHYNYKLTSY